MYERNARQMHSVEHRPGKEFPKSLKNSGGKSGKSLPSSYLEIGYRPGDFLCQSFALPMALFALPLLGEPATAPNPP